MAEINYKDRIKAQIDQYASTINMHDLPDIFHFWSHNYLAPGMKNVFGTSSIEEAYAVAYREARERTSGHGEILSIGCGDGGVEIRVAEILLDAGVRDFTFTCADVSPILLDRLRQSVAERALDRYFQPVQADLNRIQLPGTYDVVMANHSLHHIQGLESLFSYSHNRLKQGGVFATCDMIGRNGHMRWPEAAAVVRALWPTLKPHQRYHAQLKRYGETFIDHDCSNEGFEGIRSQDILPLILRQFYPYRFFAGGGFIDVFVDRSYGHGYDVQNESDVDFMRWIAELNDMLLDADLIKPTWMMAYFTVDNRGEVFFRNRSAAASVRDPDKEVAWTRFYGHP